MISRLIFCATILVRLFDTDFSRFGPRDRTHGDRTHASRNRVVIAKYDLCT